MNYQKKNALTEAKKIAIAEQLDQSVARNIYQTRYLTEEQISTFSHEFRTPLNGILGMSEALLEEVFGGIDEKQLEAINIIHRSGLHLSVLVNSLLDISKIQNGRLELEITDVLVADLCYSSSNFVMHQAIQKQINFEIDIQNNIESICVDMSRLQQVIISIVNQAIARTPIGGEVKLVVSCDNIKDRNSSVVFAISDTSNLVVSNQNDDPFQSWQSTQNNAALGLSLVEPVVELHGGFTSYHYTNGKGNTINISLPNTCLKIKPDIIDDEVEDSSGFGLNSFSDEVREAPLILIAEDNELNIDTLFSYLAAKGYQPIVAQDGKTAVEMTEKYHPDLILMDIQMPGMDGLEAITRIRQFPESKKTPIIVLTAMVMSKDQEKCFKVGANEYVSKPIQLKELNKMIQNFLMHQVDNSCPQSDFFFS